MADLTEPIIAIRRSFVLTDTLFNCIRTGGVDQTFLGSVSMIPLHEMLSLVNDDNVRERVLSLECGKGELTSRCGPVYPSSSRPRPPCTLPSQ